MSIDALAMKRDAAAAAGKMAVMMTYQLDAVAPGQRLLEQRRRDPADWWKDN